MAEMPTVRVRIPMNAFSAGALVGELERKGDHKLGAEIYEQARVLINQDEPTKPCAIVKDAKGIVWSRSDNSKSDNLPWQAPLMKRGDCFQWESWKNIVKAGEVTVLFAGLEEDEL